MNPPLRVAGIGASAGGLEALRPLLANLPRSGCLAYVIAQHMAADAHAELMVGLLGRAASVEVALAHDGEALSADRVYVLPAGCDGVVRGGRVYLQAPAAGSLSRPSVNVLLDSLARDQGELAIGIIVSGTGSDGARGCRAILAGGGVTFAQTPESAQYSGMPEAAIDAGAIVHVLPPERIGESLARLCPDPGPLPPSAAPDAPLMAAPSPVPALSQVLQRVREATGLDFTGYKDETLLRRLRGRLASLGLDSFDDYQRHLSSTPAELETLANHFLVSMSAFYRDRESFRAVERALRDGIARKPAGEPLRIWVPGCATGEECWTLAIIASTVATSALKVDIVGTDLNARALAQAEAGLYPESALKEVETDISNRSFIRRGALYEVNEPLRRMCSFARHDVVHDPPPPNLDVISCRNLLIYMQSELQGRLMRRFHGALRPDGLLFIGQSETIGLTGTTLFLPVDAEQKLYRRRPT